MNKTKAVVWLLVAIMLASVMSEVIDQAKVDVYVMPFTRSYWFSWGLWRGVATARFHQTVVGQVIVLNMALVRVSNGVTD